MGAGLVQPEDGRVAGGAGAGDGQLHPVPDRRVLGLAGAEDVALRHRLLDEHVAGLVDQTDRTGGLDLEGLVVGAVLLGLLRHEADVRDRAHGRRVVGAVGTAVVDHGLVDPGVGGVRQHREGVGLLAVRAPHVAGGADHRRHRGVHDHVGRHVQVGDALVGVDHGQGRALGELAVEGRLDLGAVRQRVQALEDAAQTVVRGQTGGGEVGAVPLEGLGEEGAHDVAEDDRVGDLHHRRLEVHGEQDALLLGAGDLRLEELAQRGDSHHGGVDDLTGEDRYGLAQDGGGAVLGDVLDPQRAGLGDHDGLLGGTEVVRSSWTRRSRRPCGAGGSWRSS